MSTSASNASNPSDPPFFVPGRGPIGLLIHILTHPRVIDYVKLIFLGVCAEASRRLLMLLGQWFAYYTEIQSVHLGTDESYDWLMTYWVSHPTWKHPARKFQCESKEASPGARIYPWLIYRATADKVGSIIDKFADPKPYYVPEKGSAHYFIFNGHLVKFKRVYTPQGVMHAHREQISVTILARNKSIFVDLLAAAKRQYLEASEGKLSIKMVVEGNREGSWREVALRHPRRMNSVVTEVGVKERLLKDIRGFLRSESFYVARGIPWRRGILLHGLPGSGKTSTILALASELKLDVYVFTLSTAGMTDALLNRCMTLVPAGAAVVMEDIDVALKTKRRKGGKKRTKDAKGDIEDEEDDKEEDGSKVTLSGVLNAIDGMAGSEGRVLFMTTNHREKLDPALIRPGRADLSIEYFNASQGQAADFFKFFYGVQGETSVVQTAAAKLNIEEKNSTEDEVLEEVDAEKLELMAREWSVAIPDRQFSTASLQGMLMLYKHEPEEAVANISAWVATELEERARQDEQAAQATRTQEEAKAARLAKEEETKKEDEADSRRISEEKGRTEEEEGKKKKNEFAPSPKIPADTLPASSVD